MHTKSLKQLSALIQGKQLSATELAELYLARIGASDLNAFISIDPALTLEQARAADDRIA